MCLYIMNTSGLPTITHGSMSSGSLFNEIKKEVESITSCCVLEPLKPPTRKNTPMKTN